MNQLRLVHLLDRTKQSPIKISITLLVKKSLLSPSAIEAMEFFNQQYPRLDIVDIDSIFPLLTHPDDRHLSFWVNAEIAARRPESARDLLTAIPYIAHRFGQYFDFDVSVRLNDLPLFIEYRWISSPELVLPVVDKTVKYSFSNDIVFVTSRDFYKISEEDARTCLKPVILTLLKNYSEVSLESLLSEKCWKEHVFQRIFEKQLLVIRQRQMNIPEIHAAWDTLFSYADWEADFLKMYHIESTCAPEALKEWKVNLNLKLRRRKYNNPVLFMDKATDLLLGESHNSGFETPSIILKKIFELLSNNLLKNFVIDISGPQAYLKGYNLKRQIAHYSYISQYILSSAVEITHLGGSDLSWLSCGQRRMQRKDSSIFHAALVIQRARKSYLKKSHTHELEKMNRVAIQLALPISRIDNLSSELRQSLYKTVRVIQAINPQLLTILSYDFLLSVSQDIRIAWHAALTEGFFKRSCFRENLDLMVRAVSLPPAVLMNILQYCRFELDILMGKMSVPLDLILTGNQAAMNFLIKIYHEEIALEAVGIVIDLCVERRSRKVDRYEFTRWPQFFSQAPVKSFSSGHRYDLAGLIEKLFASNIDLIALEIYCEALMILHHQIQLTVINFLSLDESERKSLLRSAHSVIYLVNLLKIPYQRLWYREDGHTKIDAEMREAFFNYPEKLVWLVRVGIPFNQWVNMEKTHGLLLFDNAGLLFHFCPYALPMSRLISLDLERKKQLFLFSTEYLALVDEHEVTVDDIEKLTLPRLNKLLQNVSNRSLVQSILSSVRAEEYNCHCL